VFDLERIKREIDTLPEYDLQIALQGIGDGDYQTGTISWKTKEINENEHIHFNFDLPYINSIITELNLCRTRVMRLRPISCYHYHWDKTPRIHIPVITNTHCIFMVDKELKEIKPPYHDQDICSTDKDIFHLPADGNYYTIDTTMCHTAINLSPYDRIHIVGCPKS
jgi:hypothetical protein